MDEPWGRRCNHRPRNLFSGVGIGRVFASCFSLVEVIVTEDIIGVIMIYDKYHITLTNLNCTYRDANIYDLGVIYTIYSPRLRLYDPHMIFYDFPRFYVNKIKCVQFVLHVVS